MKTISREDYTKQLAEARIKFPDEYKDVEFQPCFLCETLTDNTKVYKVSVPDDEGDEWNVERKFFLCIPCFMERKGHWQVQCKLDGVDLDTIDPSTINQCPMAITG